MTGLEAWGLPGHPLAGLVAAVVAGVLGWFAPHLVARLPEPAPEPAPEPTPEPEHAVEAESEAESEAEPAGRLARAAEPEDPKPLYADIAATSGAGVRLAVASAVVAGFLGASVGWTGAWAYLVLLAPVGTALAWIDWRTTYLPTRIIAPTYAVLGALLLLAALVDRDPGALLHAVLGWLVIGGLFFAVWFVFPTGWGYGDVRLSGVLGLALGYLGWAEVLVGLYAILILGGVGQVLLLALRKVRARRAPYGPFMVLGAAVGVVLGPSLLAGLGR